MFSKKLLLAGLGVVILGLSAAIATPALATVAAPTLPASDSLFAINCQGEGNPSVWSVPTSGAATPIGADTSVACASGGSYDPVSKTFYFIERHEGYYLSSFDPTTGTVTRGPMFGGEMYEPHQLAFDDSGHGFVVGLGNGAFFDSLDVTTGGMTRIGTTNQNVYSMAFNPVDRTLYGFSWSGGMVFTVDPSTGLETTVRSGVTYAQGYLPAPDSATPTGDHPNGVTFDSNGIAWIRMDGNNAAAASIVAYDPTTNESWSTGTLVDATGLVYPTVPHYWQSNTFLVGPGVIAPPDSDPSSPPVADPTSTTVPDPTLAMTGMSGSTMVLLAGGVALIALLGAGAVVSSRRRAARP